MKICFHINIRNLLKNFGENQKNHIINIELLLENIEILMTNLMCFFFFNGLSSEIRMIKDEICSIKNMTKNFKVLT